MRNLCLPLMVLLAACKDGGEGDGPDDTDPVDGPGGCFTINGSGGWPSLEAAYAASADGDSIELCGEIEMDLVVEKSVTLVGKGAGDTLWIAPTNKRALTVENGAAVTVEGISFVSTRSGIQVEVEEGASPASLTVRDVAITADNYGIENTGGVVIVENSQLIENGWGGVYSKGGSVTVTGSTFTGNVDFGVMLEEGASGTISGNTFTGTLPSSDDLEFGWGVKLDNASADLSGNTFSLNQYGDVRANGGLSVLTMNGDVSDSSLIGVWINAGTATLTDTSFTNYVQYGLVDEGGITLDLVNPTFTTTHEGSAPATGTSNDDFSGSFGLVILGADTTITGGTISGHNGGGIWQNPGQSTEAVRLDLNGTTIADNNRFGVVTIQGEMTFTDVTVSGTVDDEPTCCDDSGCWCDMAVASWLSDITWNGGTLSGNGTFGLTVLAGSADVSNVTFTQNEIYGAYSQDSAFVCDTCTFDAGKAYGMYLYNSGAVIENSTFQNATYTQESEYTDTSTGTVYSYIYHYQAQDIVASQSTLEISGSTFSNGENGITTMFSEPTTIVDTTFDGYNNQPVYAYDSTVELSRTDFTNTGGDAVYCYLADVTMDKVKVQGVSEYDYWYESYVDGELSYEYSAKFQGNGLYASNCSMSLEDVTMSDFYTRGLYLWDTAVEMDGVSMRAMGTNGSDWDAAIYAYYSSTTPDMILNNVTITDVQHGYGIYVTISEPWSGETCGDRTDNDGDGATDCSDTDCAHDAACGEDCNNSVDDDGDGLQDCSDSDCSAVASCGYVEMVGLKIGDSDGTGTSNAGVYLSGFGNTTMSTFDIRNTGSDGIYLNNATASLQNGTITSPIGFGVWTNESALDADNVMVTDATQSGFYLGGGSHSVNGSTVTGADRYGVECAGSVSFDGCTSNSLEGTLGETYDCGCDI